MSRNRGSDTGPEMALRGALWRMGLRYRLKSSLIGRPDIVFPGARVVVFVDGCFWHGCPEHGVRPRTNSKFWDNKIGRTQERDRYVTQRLLEQGWQVIRVWEHQVLKDLDGCCRLIAQSVNQGT